MSSYRVTRTFHPVGQGAFYSERHNKFNIVYDCGTTAYAKARPVVKSAFLYQDIDILFISHFDNDHISTIEALRDSTNNIHTVVMPLLEPKHEKLLINLSSALPTGSLNLIKDPQTFFGSNTTIVRVRSTQERNRDESDNPINLPNPLESSESISVQSSSPPSIIINSGRPLIINNEYRWVFVPYNIKFTDRHAKLINQLESLGFDVSELEKNPNYVMDSLKDSKSRKTLKNIYDKKLGGDINENSMLLYSGPSKDSESSDICYCELIGQDSVYSCECFNSAGCIYTGDSDLNEVLKEEDDVYLDYRRCVGIIQIPHHGSKENFNIRFFEQFYPVICPVSYGTKNSHGHPAAEVINELSMNKFRPILVNEQLSSKFVQEIEFNWLN